MALNVARAELSPQCTVPPKLSPSDHLPRTFCPRTSGPNDHLPQSVVPKKFSPSDHQPQYLKYLSTNRKMLAFLWFLREYAS